MEKRRFSESTEALENELESFKDLLKQYQEDIVQLEEKLKSAKEKKRLLLQRHKRATGKKRALEDIRRSDSADTMARFDKLESRIEQMEAEADLVNMPKKPSVADEFEDLATDDEIEKELANIKAAQYSKNGKSV